MTGHLLVNKGGVHRVHMHIYLDPVDSPQVKDPYLGL